jgi:hypothetical protein
MRSSVDLIRDAIPVALLEAATALPAATTPGLAWPASQALQVIEFLVAARLIISGGDVWEIIQSTKFVPAYSDWSYPGEDMHLAAQIARQYVSSYPRQTAREIVFTFACHVAPAAHVPLDRPNSPSD